MKFSRFFRWKKPDSTDEEQRPRNIIGGLYAEEAARRYINAENQEQREAAERQVRCEAWLVDVLNSQRRGRSPSPPEDDPRLDPRQHVAQAILAHPSNLGVPRAIMAARRERERKEREAQAVQASPPSLGVPRAIMAARRERERKEREAQAVQASPPSLGVPRAIMAARRERLARAAGHASSGSNAQWVPHDGNLVNTALERDRREHIDAGGHDPYYVFTTNPLHPWKKMYGRPVPLQNPELLMVPPRSASNDRSRNRPVQDDIAYEQRSPESAEPPLPAPVPLPYAPSTTDGSLAMRLEASIRCLETTDQVPERAETINSGDSSTSKLPDTWGPQEDNQEPDGDQPPDKTRSEPDSPQLEFHDEDGPDSTRLRRSDAVKRKPGQMWLEPNWHDGKKQ